MTALRARFVAQAQEEARAIEAQLEAGGWLNLRDISHGLSGRAGMFGCPAIGDAARAVEDAIDAGAARAEIGALVGALLARMRELPQGR